MPDNSITPKIESGQVDPKEVAAIEKSLKGKEQAPTIAEQSLSSVDWKRVRDELGQPFDFERLSIKKLRQLRLDAMIAFGLHYRKTPLVRAQYHVEARDKNGPNAQVAGFMDAAWRKIHARYVFQHTQDFEFGFAGIVKRFQMGNPGGVYFDPLEEDPTKALKPVWDEGNVEPVIWKPFVGLPPDKITPNFDNNGEFAGIIYELTNAQQGGRALGIASRARGGKGNDKERIIDVYHSLWATNAKDQVYGSIYGYPLIQYAFRFWWSYWFLWANLDRAFERMAVPPLLAYHPEGDYTDTETGESRPYWEIAIEAAERLRSNAIAAVPSTLATAGLDERGTQQREWAFEFVETPTENFDALGKHLSYLDVMKLRSIWVPEQAFIEGEGGTSSRNVAAQMEEIFLESQANKWEEIADHINRYIFPQLLAVNFPEFVNNGGTARIVGHGFAKEDVEFLKQIIQLIGQSHPEDLDMIDIREAFSRIGTPLKSPEALAIEQARIAEQQATAGPPEVPPAPGQVGTIVNPGGTNGGSVPGVSAVAGFSNEFVYVNPNEVIELSDHDDYLADLPNTDHYKDKTMRALSVQLRRTWLGVLRELYPDFAKHVNSASLELSDDLPEDYDDWDAGLMGDEQYDGSSVLFAERNRNRRKATRLANRLIKEWTVSSKRLAQASAQTRTIMERMVKRAAVLAGRKGSLEADTYEAFLNRNIARLVKSVEQTTRDNLRPLLVNSIMDGDDSATIAKKIEEHFTDFPSWRADRIARSETRDAYNAGTLIGAEENGLRYVKAKDAQKGPTDEFCEERDGKLYTVREAWKEMVKVHPNDTLGFVPIVRANFSVKTVDELPPNAPEDAEAWFDQESETAYVPLALSDEDADEFLRAVAEVL